MLLSDREDFYQNGDPLNQRHNDRALASDLQSIGRIPRLLSLTWTILGGLLVAFTFPAIWYVSFAIFLPALTSLILSMRVKARIDDGTLVVRSYFRTSSINLKDVNFFGVDDYVGLWTLGKSSFLIGLAQLDVTVNSGSRSKGLPATLTRTRVTKSLVENLNIVCEAERATPPHSTASESNTE
ncbi:hypothetical protein [Microbacterium azadirachtae]|uniref:hypothetical protein n=1 Tax=Microbacterium azadirachtae TaxID=582680 RepID=UPI003F752C10